MIEPPCLICVIDSRDSFQARFAARTNGFVSVSSGTRLRLRQRTSGKLRASSIDHRLELLRDPAARRRAGAVTHRAGPPAKSKAGGPCRAIEIAVVMRTTTSLRDLKVSFRER
jgi:hypothetical protein